MNCVRDLTIVVKVGLALMLVGGVSNSLVADELLSAEAARDQVQHQAFNAVPHSKTKSLELAENTNQSAPQAIATPDALIQKATEELVGRIKEATQDQKTIAFYYNLVDEKVSPFVDFKLIARRVMGRHYKLSSVKEREGFALAFRESLISTYAKGIAGYKDQSLVFLPFEGVKTKKGKTRAKIEMEIRTPSDAPIKVLYQMLLDREQAWKLENIVLNGVNLGLTFRNQFSESYKANAGDFSKITASWGDS